MSELINTSPRTSSRHALLVTASATALLGAVFAPLAHAGESDNRPTVWIEIGGQLSDLGGQAEPYVPSFALVGEQHGLLSIASLEQPPHDSVGEYGSLSFQPDGSNWKFLASIQYGRSKKTTYRHQENVASFVNPGGQVQYVSGRNPNQFVNQTSDYSVRSDESHAVVDFKVGKDVGLGLWKSNMSSEIAFGVRFAQFASRTNMNLHADPYPHRAVEKYIPPLHQSVLVNQYYQSYKATPQLVRNFRGLGPSLSWDGSLPIVDANDENVEIAFDWGANLGILFGRQKFVIHHQTTGDRFTELFPLNYSVEHYVKSSSTVRSRSATVPNVGGLAGLSLKFPNAKVSFGYRADFFFGAMDGGIDTHKSYDRSFYGPFASISIGLGG